MIAGLFVLFILSLIFFVTIAFNVALDNLKEDIIEEVLDRLEVEDDER